MKNRAALFVSIAGIFLFLFFSGFNFPQEQNHVRNNKSIIKFSHKKHIEAEVECVDCHSKAQESETISSDLMPTMDKCADCHDTEDEKNCNTCHYKDVYEPLISKESPVLFNHKFHISEEKLECNDCHSGIATVDYGFQSPSTFPEMKTCSKCHSSEKTATLACNACHTSTFDLLPQTHKVADFKTDHKFLAESSDADCATCHSNQDFCVDCHASTTNIDENNSAKNFYTPYSPHNSLTGLKNQKLNFRHDLNYVYNHGIDAMSKSSECQTCHQTETFCVDCHHADKEDFLLEGSMPKNHLAPNFTTLGVGSGGGEHAKLAARDIESCASCHDTDMEDPVCITCHVDNDGIKGTNPKTHPAGFMRDVDGDWHYDDNSLCYSCHVTASASTGKAGIGFCGYCHGNKIDK